MSVLSGIRVGDGVAESESAYRPNLCGETVQAPSGLVTSSSSNKAGGRRVQHYQIGGWEGDREVGGGIIDGLFALLHFWTPFLYAPDSS